MLLNFKQIFSDEKINNSLVIHGISHENIGFMRVCLVLNVLSLR